MDCLKLYVVVVTKYSIIPYTYTYTFFAVLSYIGVIEYIPQY